MIKKTLMTTAALAASSLLLAQNPIIRDQFTADPTARVFNGKMYLYPSHDIPSPIERLKTWFCMEDYHVFSSENLTEWTDHGVIVTQNRVPWVERDSYAMWAPECVEKDGRYYFYFPAQPKGVKKGFGVGVAVAEHPEGPFIPMFKPIEGIHGIDPTVLVDKDGQSYIYWPEKGQMVVAKLKDNMMELATEPQPILGLPDGFKEGPFVFRRGNKYYFTFPWLKTQKSTESLVYAMSDSPTGPFEFKGTLMDESPTGCWTNHHSIVEYKNQWYLFYHHNDYSPQFDKNRSARIDSLFFEADGTIRKVKPTLRGVGVTDARSRIEIDRYSSLGRKTSVSFLNPQAPFEGWKTVFASAGANIRYASVDFGQGVWQAVARVKTPKGGQLAFRTYGNQPQTIASMKLPATDEWTLVKVPVKNSPTGVTGLELALESGRRVEVDYVGFDGQPWTTGAFATRQYRNLFAEMGYSQSEIDARLQRAYDDLFTGPNKIYFEVGDSMAYISDVKNEDVRTEGMSYGLMVAVQWDKKDMFDRLWRWGRKYMQHPDGERKGYFAWSCKTDGTRNAQGPASDGELYYVTSLIFASNRWGNDGEINYLKEAQHILDCSMMKTGMEHSAPFINIEHQLITFTPDSWGGRFTDPSYHVPAFYEVWARWAQDGRSAFWRQCAEKSREYLHRSIHPVTALNPDYNNYDGSLLRRGGIIGDAFRYDSWRVPMNMALDYSWTAEDRRWKQDYANRFQNFLYSKGINTFVDQYNVDGTDVEEILLGGHEEKYRKLRHSLGLVATSAAASLMTTHEKSREFVEQLWNARLEPYEDGYIDAYYDGLLRLFAIMHLSGRYRIIFPAEQ